MVQAVRFRRGNASWLEPLLVTLLAFCHGRTIELKMSFEVFCRSYIP